MNDVNPEGGGEASRENPIGDALGGTIKLARRCSSYEPMVLMRKIQASVFRDSPV